MKPYYEDNLVQVYQGDAREVLPQLTRKFDLIIADPPYGQTSLAWDKWPAGWIDYVRQVLTPCGSMWCFGSLRMFMKHCQDFSDWSLAQDIVWEKHNGSSFHADRFRRVHESIAHFYPKSAKWEDIYHSPVFTMDATKRTTRRKGRPPHMGEIGDSSYESEDGDPRFMRSVQFMKSTHGYAVHPTQKPVGIILPLLQYSCPPNGVVLDLFSGGLSTCVAAKQLGLHVVAIEVNSQYLDPGIKRLVSPLEHSAESRP